MLSKRYYQPGYTWLFQIPGRIEERDRRTGKEQPGKQKLPSGYAAIYVHLAARERMKKFQMIHSKQRHSWSTRQALSQAIAQTLGDTFPSAFVHHMAWQALVVRFHLGDFSYYLILLLLLTISSEER